MSAVNRSGGDRANGEDTVRRVRENYQANEGEQAKRYKKDLARLQDQHQQELERLRGDYETRMENLKKDAAEQITSRDMKYQQDSEGMRAMQQKQLTKMMKESQERLQVQRDAYQGELDKTKQINDLQKQDMRDKFGNELAQKDKKLTVQQQTLQEGVQQQTADTKRRMNEAHAKELKALTAGREKELREAERNYSQLRKAKDDHIHFTEQQHDYETTRKEAEYKGQIDNVQSSAQSERERLRKGFSQGLDDVRDRYQKALDDNSEMTRQAREDMQRSAGDRINNRLEATESNYRRLQEESKRARIDNQRDTQTQLGNLRNEFGKNIDIYERQRRELVQANNSKTADEIDKANKKNSELLARTNNFFQDKASMDSARSNERLMQQKLDSENRIQHETLTSETRFEKLKNASDMELARLQNYYDQTLAAQRENFEQTLRQYREETQATQQTIFASMNKQAQENDQKNQRRMEEVQIRYEKQINALKDQFAQERKELMAQADRRVEDIEKKYRVDIESQKSKYEYRLTRADEGHQKDIDNLRRRHEESFARLTEVKKA